MLLMPNMPEIAAYAPRVPQQTTAKAAAAPDDKPFAAAFEDARALPRETQSTAEPVEARPDADAAAPERVAAPNADPTTAQAVEEDVAPEAAVEVVADEQSTEVEGDPDTTPALTDVHVKIEVEVITPVICFGPQDVPTDAATPVSVEGVAEPVDGETIAAQLAGAAVELAEAAIEAFTRGDESPEQTSTSAIPKPQPAATTTTVAGTPAPLVPDGQMPANATVSGEVNAAAAQRPQVSFTPQAKTAAATEAPAPVVAEAAPQAAVQAAPTTADEQPASDQQQAPTPQPQVSDAKPGAPITLPTSTANPVATAAAPTPAPETASPTGSTPPTTLATPQAPEADDGSARVNEARISRGFQNAVHQGGGSITLRLTPSELGTVRIQMQLMGTSVSADIHTETEAARVTLSGQLTQLRQALESQGLSVDRLNVQSMTTSGSQPQQFSQSDQGADGRSRGFMGQEGRQREGSPQGQQDGPGGRRQRFDEALLSQAS